MKSFPIEIGKGAVFKSLGQYRNFVLALYEVLINSMDEGATEIGIFISPDQVVIMDNGSGMDERDDETGMIKAFINMYKPIKRGVKGKQGYHNVGSWAWIYWATHGEFWTCHSDYIDTDKPVRHFVIDAFEIQRRGVIEGELIQVSPVEMPAFIKSDGTFTVQRFKNLRCKIKPQEVIRKLSELLPFGRECKVRVNDCDVPLRTYEGEPLTHKEPIVIEGTEASVEIELYAPKEYLKTDKVYLIVQGRGVPLSVLRNDFEIPEVYFSDLPKLCGQIRADFLAPYTLDKRSDLTGFHAPEFRALEKVLQEFAPFVDELVSGRQEEMQLGKFNDIRDAVVSDLQIAASSKRIIGDELDHIRDYCYVCDINLQRHSCMALRGEMICYRCCSTSWKAKNLGKGESPIPDCTSECKFFGKKPTRSRKPDGDENPDNDDIFNSKGKKKKDTTCIRMLGKTIFVEVLNQGGKQPFSWEQRTENTFLVMVDTDHEVMAAEMEDSKKAACKWAKVQTAMALGEIFGYVTGTNWEFAMKFLSATHDHINGKKK